MILGKLGFSPIKSLESWTQTVSKKKLLSVGKCSGMEHEKELMWNTNAKYKVGHSSRVCKNWRHIKRTKKNGTITRVPNNQNDISHSAIQFQKTVLPHW